MNCENICEKIANVWEKTTKYLCPFLYYIIYSRRDEYRLLKTVSAFFYGILLALAFYELILIDLRFSTTTCLAIAGVIGLVLGLANALSIQARCISLLTTTAFTRKSGQMALRAVIVAYIVAGPIHNTLNNGREVIRVFGCSTILAYNLTKTRFDLMVRPFAEAILNLKADTSEVKDTVKSIEGIVLPLADEIEGEEDMRKVKEDNDYIDELQGDSNREEEIEEKYKEEDDDPEESRYEKRYKRKMESKCEDIMSHGAGSCRRAFAELYDKCYEKVSWVAAWLLCWPMKLTHICNIVEAMGGSKPCDASRILEPGFGEGYSFLKRTGTSLADTFKGVQIQYKVSQTSEKLDVQQVTDTAEDMNREFERGKEILDTCLTIVMRLLSFTFAKILLDDQKYHDAYLSDVQFDNVYVTKYFKRIDKRRHKKHQHTLLPLKNMERATLIDPYSSLLTTLEFKKLARRTIKLIVEVGVVTLVILLDYLLYEALDLIRRHGRIDYVQEGSHDLMLRVKGTGFVAKLVRSILGGFDIRERVKTTWSNEACLPQPTKLHSSYLYKIYGIYLFIWFFRLTQAYTKRIQRAICAYFYPKREKRRVLFLYNETLKRRRGLFRFMKAKVKRLAREHKLELDANICLVLRIRYAAYFSWLRWFGAARRKCLICEEPEPRKPRKEENFVSCPNPKCHFVYCFECWNDLKHICFACNTPPQSDDDDDDEEEGEEYMLIH